MSDILAENARLREQAGLLTGQIMHMDNENARLRDALREMVDGFDRGIAIYEEHGGPVALNEPIIKARSIAYMALGNES